MEISADRIAHNAMPPFAVRGDIVAKELDLAAGRDWSVARRFALLMCNVGGADNIADICARLRVPRKIKETAMAAIAASDAENLFSHSSAGIPAEKIVDKISRLDGFRNEQKMLDAAEVAQLHFGVASPNGGRDFPLPEILRRGLKAARKVDAAAIAKESPRGEIAARLRAARIKAVAEEFSRPAGE